MLKAEFAQVYNRDASYTIEDAFRSECLRADHQFGQLLHDDLTGKIELDSINLQLGEYSSWLSGSFLPNLAEITNDHDNPDATIKYLGLHTLNSSMMNEWLLMPEEPCERNSAIKIIQGTVAINGLQLYIQREGLFRARQPAGDPPGELETDLEGLLAEHDAAIILLEIQRKHPEIRHILPAPHQFDRGKKAYNSDFIILTKGEADGVQVKSRVRPEHITSYDPNYVMLLDADNDLDDVLARRIGRGSTPRVIGWAGIICAQFIDKIQTRGKERFILDTKNSQSERAVLNLKYVAKNMVAGIKPNFSKALDRIEGRLLSRINID